MDRAFRSRVADAVHRAVCRFTGSDGYGKCHLYSLAGSVLLSSLTNRLYLPQAGSILICVDPPDRWVGIEIDRCCDSLTGLANGQYHCWIADATNCAPGVSIATTLIDLSSRHYKAMAATGRIWQSPDPPIPLWIDDGLLPSWLQLKPDTAASEAVIRDLTDDTEIYAPLICEAQRQYRKLAEKENLWCRVRDQRAARKAERQRRKQARRHR